jgi:hypothetical protein
MDLHILVYLFHLFIVGPLFLYVGIYRDHIPKIMYSILLYLGIFIIFLHIFKVYNYIKLGKGYWVNLIHIFMVGPILIYIGYNREKTSRLFYELLLMLGFAAIGYHGYYLLRTMLTK